MSRSASEAPAALSRFARYEAYRDSGIQWLGEIPTHWDARKMWRISRAISGGTPTKEEPRYWGGDIPWVSPKDMKRRFIDSSEDSITSVALHESGLKLLSPPSVLIVVRGMILAHSFPVAVTRVPVTINQDMKALQLRPDIEPSFIAWVFEGAGMVLLGAVVEEAAHGTRAIRMDQWRSVTVPVPPRTEQRAIVEFLDRETAKIDALVAKKERLIELLQEQRTALISCAVTKGLNPSVPMKDSGIEWLGEIPAHWAVKPLRWELCVRSGEALDNTQFGLTHEVGRDVAVVGGNGVMGYASHVNIDIACIAIGRVGALCGNVHLVEPPAWVTDNALVVSGIRSFERKYLALLLRVLDLNRWASQNAQPLITGGFVKAQTACLPPGVEQDAIVAFLDRETLRIDALIARVRDAIDRVKELRTALISAAVTGKIDVREEAT